jgi:hypothetical protein
VTPDAPAPAAGPPGWPRPRLADLVNGPLTRRGLGFLFFFAAAGFVSLGWLRPPLSPDISALRLPLWPGQVAPEEILYGPPRVPFPGVGTLLLGLAVAGAALVLWRPRSLSVAAGLLLSAALAANAVAVCNFPALIELLDLEQEQRQHMTAVLASPAEPPPLTGERTSRSPGAHLGGRGTAPAAYQEPAGLLRGWFYLLHGPRLVYLAAAAVLLAGRGSLARRLAVLGPWVLAGVALAAVTCGPRLLAEQHWSRAEELAAGGDGPGASAELQTAVTLFPQFERLQRTWLLAGRLDFLAGRTTPRAQFFRAYRHALRKEYSLALGLLEELLSGTEGDSPAVRLLAGRVAVSAALDDLARRDLAASADLGGRAASLVPADRLARLLTAVAQGRADLGRPELVEEGLGPLLGPGVADRALQADSLVVLGNAYFAAGRFQEARRCYARSLDLFQLPRQDNFRAEKALGGL